MHRPKRTQQEEGEEKNRNEREKKKVWLVKNANVRLVSRKGRERRVTILQGSDEERQRREEKRDREV